jgi:hypothetical protein
VSADADDSGDDVVVLQRLLPGEHGIRTLERRVPIDTVVTIEPARG